MAIEQIAEKQKLLEMDAKENLERIRTLNTLKSIRIMEKQKKF